MVTITGIAMLKRTVMTDQQNALYRLQTWFSPSFPVGAYTYSHAMENAFERGFVQDLDETCDWISDIICQGSGFADAVFLKEAHIAVQTDRDRLRQIVEYAAAFAGTKELRLESEAQGAAFIELVQNVEPNEGLSTLMEVWPGPFPFAVAVGAAAGALKIDQHNLCTAYLHAFASNLSSALVRIVPLGQTDGQRIIARLATSVSDAVTRALDTPYEDVTVSTLMVDLCSMHHETQYTRLFRS